MTNLLEVSNLSKIYYHYRGIFQPRQRVTVVNNISFTLRKKQTLAITGGNGAGKSTLAKMLCGMIMPSTGEISIHGHPLQFGDYSFRSRRMRMIFQNPDTALNPRQRVGQILALPLRLHTDLDEYTQRNRIVNTLQQVGLLPDHANYYPYMLAPGQRQRVGLARALILRPKIIIADEALASQDVSMHAQLINLLLDLQERHGISYIYVSQHLGLIKHISDQLIVMQRGEIVEYGTTANVLATMQPEKYPTLS